MTKQTTKTPVKGGNNHSPGGDKVRKKTLVGKVLRITRQIAFYAVLLSAFIVGYSDSTIVDQVKLGPIFAIFALLVVARPVHVCKAKYNRLRKYMSSTDTEGGNIGFNIATMLSLCLIYTFVVVPMYMRLVGLVVIFLLPKEVVRQDAHVLNSDTTRFFGIGSAFGKDNCTSALLHDLAILVLGVWSSRSNVPALISVYSAFFTAQVRTGLIPSLPDTFADSLEDVIKHIVPILRRTPHVVNSGSWTGFLKSKQVKSMVTILVVAVATLVTLIQGDFSSDRVMAIYDGYMATFDSNPVRFGTNIVEAVRVTFTSIVSYAKTGEFDWFCHSSKDYQELQARFEKIQGQYINFGSSNNDPESSALVSDVMKLEADTIAAAKMSRTLNTFTSKFTKPMLESFLANVTSLKCKITSRHHLFGMRRAPFTALVVGPPSIGKTTITSHIVRVFCSVYGYQYRDELIYKPNKSSEYDDGFQSNMHSCILDDVAELRPQKAQGLDPSIGDLIGLIGNFPQMANMAHVDEKATKTKNFDCVVANTNTLDLNVRHYFACPEAVLRRFPYVILPKVKPEFRRDDQLDSTKVAMAGFEVFDDAWTYTIKKVSLVEGKVVYTDLITDVDMKTYFQTLVHLMQTHKGVQDSVIKQTSNLANVQFCETSHMPKNMCDCMTCAALSEPEAEPIMDEASAPEPIPVSVRIGSAAMNSADEQDQQGVLMFMIQFLVGFALTLGLQTIVRKMMGLWCDSTSLAQTPPGPTTPPAPTVGAWDVAPGLVARAVPRVPPGPIEPPHELNSADDSKTGLSFFSQVLVGCLTGFGFATLVNFMYVSVRDRMLHNFYRYALANLGANLEVDRLIGLATTVAKYLVVGGAGYLIFRALMPGVMPHVDATDENDNDACFRPVYPNDHRENTYLNLWSHKPIETSHRSKCTINSPTETHHGSVLRSTYATVFSRRMPDGTFATRRANTIHIKDGVYVTTSHCAWHGESEVAMKFIGERRDVLVTNYFKPEDFVRQGELIYFRVDGLQSKPIHDLLVKNVPASSRVLEGHTLMRRIDTQNWDSTTHRVAFTTARVTQTAPRTLFGADVAQDQETLYCMRNEAPAMHARGDCGSPIVANTEGGLAIVSLHVGETQGTTQSYGIPISQEIVAGPTEALTQSYLNSAQTTWLDAAEGEPMLKEGEVVIAPHEKSPLGFIKEPLSVALVGSIGNADGTRAFRTGHRSEVVNAICRDYVTERGYGTDHGAPEMRKRWVAVNYLLKASVIPFSHMPQKAIWAIADHLLDKYLAPLDLNAFGVLTDSEVINGVEGSAFISAIDMRKGSGYPFLTKKSKLLEPKETPDEPHRWLPHVMDHINEVRDKLATGDRVGFVFNAFYKDEPVKAEKIAAMKTRVICGCPVALQHLARQYFLPIIAEMTRVAKWEGAVGINATGPEWGVIARMLQTFGGDKIIAGDFEGFDWKTINNGVLKPAFGILIAMARRSGKYSARHIKIMEGIATEISHSYLDYFGDLIMMYSNPSGQPLTTHINCIVVAIVMRLCWCAHRLGCEIYQLHPSDPRFAQALEDFEIMCRLVHYGDDHGLATKDETFTFAVIKGLLTRAGMGYTSTDKSENTHDFETLDQVTFLKRGFKYENGRWLAPLDLSSIKKSLNAVRKSTLGAREHIAAVLVGHHRELAFHEETVFNEYTQLFDDIVDEFGLDGYLNQQYPVATGSHFPNRDYYLDLCFSEEVEKRSLMD